MARFVRFGPSGAEKPGALDKSARIRDLSGHVPDLAGAHLSPARLARLAEIDPESLPLAPPGARIGPCVGESGKFICIGLNFKDHARALDKDVPKEPAIAMKPVSAISGPYDGIELPRASCSTDWEVELGVVIGQKAKYIEEHEARAHIAGYCLINDLADRDLQSNRGGDTSKGRGHDTFGPIGPYLVPARSVADPQGIRLWLEVDGERLQDGTTADMIFSVDYLVAYISQFMTLLPGDVISTGTPAGIGVGMTPPRFLKPGQRVRLGGDGLGEQEHEVRRSSYD
jgi:2-keto-4-pentenoate hydratase/2-oxohepta-3-ene-1,7-dioic acid hydratase in catechol pathway